MFMYCDNNPVNCVDISGSITFYGINNITTTDEETDANGNHKCKTVISYRVYRLENSPYFEVYDETITICFTVEYSGKVVLDNSQDSAGLLSDTYISKKMAEEVYNAATTIVPGALSGRTIEGIAREIKQHNYIGRKTGLSTFIIADIGGTDKSRDDYDYNARAFEDYKNIPSVACEYILGKIKGIWGGLVK